MIRNTAAAASLVVMCAMAAGQEFTLTPFAWTATFELSGVVRQN